MKLNVVILGAIADVETDGEGRFLVPGLSPGEYRIEVNKPNYEGTALRVRVVEGEASVTRVMIPLMRWAAITGRVTNPQGQAVRDASVFAMTKSAGDQTAWPLVQSRRGAFAVVDDRGHYRLYGLAPGRYAVAVRYGASGRVELPAPNARFSLALRPVDEPALAIAKAQAAGTDGRFRFEGIPPGSYRLFASGPAVGISGQGAVLGSEPLFGQAQVEVQQNVVGISLSVEKGRSAGFLLRHATPDKADSLCPRSTRLTLSALEDLGALVHRSAEVTVAKETVIEDLAPARYRVSLSPLGESCYPVADTVIDLTDATPIIHVVVAVSPAGSVRGRLKDAADPERTAVVLAVADPLEGVPPLRIAFADSESHFAFEDVRPGRYRVAAGPATEVVKPGWSTRLDRMLEIEVRGGASTGVELPATAEIENPEKE